MLEETPSEAAGVPACVAAVGGLFEPLGERLADGAEVIGRSLSRAVGAGPTAAEVLVAVEPVATSVLTDPRLLGGGFIANPDRLADVHLTAWWQGEVRDRMSASAALRRAIDYTRKEWYSTPIRTRRLHVTGPYVDYVCSDEFVLTLTVPVVDQAGEALGLLGVDVLAETVESILGSAFRGAGANLLNHHDRVVVAGDRHSFAGDQVDPSAYDTRTPCPGLPFAVVA